MGDTKRFFAKHHICIISLIVIALISHLLLLSGKYVINSTNRIANILFIQSAILLIIAVAFIVYLLTRNAFEERKKKRKN